MVSSSIQRRTKDERAKKPNRVRKCWEDLWKRRCRGARLPGAVVQHNLREKSEPFLRSLFRFDVQWLRELVPAIAAIRVRAPRARKAHPRIGHSPVEVLRSYNPPKHPDRADLLRVDKCALSLADETGCHFLFETSHYNFCPLRAFMKC